MIRAIAISAICVLLACVIVLLAGPAALPAYLAGWLIILAIPVGALPLVLGLELTGHGGSLQTGYLRWLLALMPVASAAWLPVFIHVPELYTWTLRSTAWMSHPFFQIRGAIYLLVWTILCLRSMRPPERGNRTIFCVIGLILHLTIGGLATSDWIGSLSPGLHSAELGLLVMSAQCVLALSVAVLFSGTAPTFATTLLAISAAVWGVLAFLQYLIVWSANRPGEIGFYVQRSDLAGNIAAWFGVAAVAFCVVMFGPAQLGRSRPAIIACTSLLLASLSAHMLWLVLPSIHGSGAPMLVDMPGELPIIALAGTALWIWHPRRAGP